MKKRVTIFLSAVALMNVMAIADSRIPADVNGDGKVNTADAVEVYNFILNMREANLVEVGAFPADGWSDDATIGTADSGKTAWTVGDVVTLSLESPALGIKTYTLTYDGEIWNADTEVIFTYLQNEMVTASATCAPQGMPGTVEYLVGECVVNEDKIEVNFGNRTYSRLRIVTTPNDVLTIPTTGFTPAGTTEETAESYTLTADEKGNAYLYGTFAEGATVEIIMGTKHTFDAPSEWGKSYALDALGINATMMTAEELEATVTMELMAGKTDIIVTMAAEPELAMFTAIRKAICNSGVADGSINLTLNGVKVLPDDEGGAGASFGYCEETGDAVTQLASVNLPDAEIIGDCVFLWCTNLTSVNVPSLISIGDAAFEGTGITSITLPSSVTSIGDDAFSGCKNLSTVKFAEDSQLESIGIYAFANSAISSISIPTSVTVIPERAFMNCDQLVSMEIPASVTSIGVAAFESSDALKTISFGCGSQLASIGEYAFSGNALETITIPATVTDLGECAFESCNQLTMVNFEENSQLTTIKYQVFYKCTNLTSFTIPQSVTTLGMQSFQESGLTSIYIPNTITNISNAFCNCANLKQVTFQEGCQMTKIDNQTFMGTGIVSIEIPASITEIGGYAFYNCQGLETVTLLANEVVSIDKNTFKSVGNLAEIYVPAGLVESYKAADIWSSYSEKIQAIVSE